MDLSSVPWQAKRWIRAVKFFASPEPRALCVNGDPQEGLRQLYVAFGALVYFSSNKRLCSVFFKFGQ